jgi:glycosyltransferase
MTRVSVVTVAFRAAPLLPRTLDSVAAQSHPDVEHIVVDGGSVDGTRELLESRPGLRWVSEPDRGLYDAMNKGWRLARGDVVGFLNADDVFAGPYVLARLVEVFDRTSAGAVYGDINLVDERERIVRRWQSGSFSRGKYHLGWMTPHPVTYVRRELFLRHGGFRLDLPIAADYELMLRFFYKERARVEYLPQTLVHMRAGGASNGSVGAVLRANFQVYRSWGLNGLFTTPSIVVTKPLSKLLQLRRGA